MRNVSGRCIDPLMAPSEGMSWPVAIPPTPVSRSVLAEAPRGDPSDAAIAGPARPLRCTRPSRIANTIHAIRIAANAPAQAENRTAPPVRLGNSRSKLATAACQGTESVRAAGGDPFDATCTGGTGTCGGAAGAPNSAWATPQRGQYWACSVIASPHAPQNRVATATYGPLSSGVRAPTRRADPCPNRAALLFGERTSTAQR